MRIINTSVKTAPNLVMASLLITSTLVLSGCGFKLHGYQGDSVTSLSSINQAVIVEIEKGQIGFSLKNSLEQKLQTLGVNTLQQSTAIKSTTINNINTNNALQVSTIKIEDIDFKQYELLGVLTEIRIIISANVNYHINTHGTNKEVKDTIQIERSYQFNEASISVENQQNKQTKQWLYDALAQRIADQYHALATH